jgi:hypothetical protein
MRISLKPNETIAVVIRRKTGVEFHLMFEDSFVEIARHANVKCEAPAGHDLAVVVAFVHWNVSETRHYRLGGQEKQMQVLRLGSAQTARRSSLRMTVFVEAQDDRSLGQCNGRNDRYVNWLRNTALI